MGSYYYLVSSLPDLALDEKRNVTSFNDFITDAQREVGAEDKQVLRKLRLPFDNTNLVTLLENRKRDFDIRGNYTKEQLSAALKSPDNVEQYMRDFLDAQRENKQLFPGLILEDQLAWVFFDAMLEDSSDFIREWYRFELNLRNIIAAINSRRGLAHLDALATERDRSLLSMLIGRNDTTETILRSSAPDFSLSQTFPWVDRLIALSKGSLTDFEKGIDTLRWDMLNEMTTFGYFGIETIAAFCIKLLIVERWMKLDHEAGKGKLDRLIEELRAGFKMPQEF